MFCEREEFVLKMEACLSVEREVNKVLDKFFNVQANNAKVLTDIQNHLRSAKNELQCDGELSDFLLSKLALDSMCLCGT